MVNKQEAVNFSTNSSKFGESRKELIRVAAKHEQMNWSNILGIAGICWCDFIYLFIYLFICKLCHE